MGLEKARPEKAVKAPPAANSRRRSMRTLHSVPEAIFRWAGGNASVMAQSLAAPDHERWRFQRHVRAVTSRASNLARDHQRRTTASWRKTPLRGCSGFLRRALFGGLA